MIKMMYKRQVLVSPVGVGCKLVQFLVYCVIACQGCQQTYSCFRGGSCLVSLWFLFSVHKLAFGQYSDQELLKSISLTTPRAYA